MKSRWNKEQAERYRSASPVGLRVYTSKLLGADPDLVLHGGGNTSVKGEVTDLFGESEPVLFVKGSGWDLRTIEAPGFPAVRLRHLLRLSTLKELSDSEMMRQLRLGLLDPSAPTPSVEAILHALIPFRFVDHSHADAVVTLSNTPDGEARLRALFGSEVLVLPYIMPGFILARQVAQAASSLDWQALRGIVLMHHGIFTFADEARSSYEHMIELVDRAEQALSQQAGQAPRQAKYQVQQKDLLDLARLRKRAGEQFTGPVLLRLDNSPPAVGFAELDDAPELITRGPLTPDHTIHAKAFGAVFGDDPVAGLTDFEKDYRDYFSRHAGKEHQCLDPMPRYGVWLGKGMVYLAPNQKRLQIVQDISTHTIAAVQQAEAVARWQALPRSDLFAVEYWELEQAKLKGGGPRPELEGKVALVTGAGSGIGRACVEELLARGAAVLALDIDAGSLEDFTQPTVLTRPCDVTDSSALKAAIAACVQHFGGLDIVISNAGCFPPSVTIEKMDSATWEQSLQVNLSSHQQLLQHCIPFLKLGFDPAVVIVASKNVPAPGPGAAAYSVAKAGLTQLARVAALELGGVGVRVNVVHPNAVYDTALWTDEVLSARAAHYGLSVAEYKKANVLGTEVSAADVARLVAAMAGPVFAKTTGAQVPVDGGNERVI